MTLAPTYPTYLGRAIDDRDWQTNSAHMGVVDVDYDVAEDALALRLDVSGAKACLFTARPDLPFVAFFASMWLKRGALTSAAGLLYTSNVQNAARSGHRMALVNADGTVTWRSKTGTALYTSAATISAATKTEFFFCLEALSSGFMVVWMCFGGTLWESFDSGLTYSEMFDTTEPVWFWGEYLNIGESRGGKLFIREIAVQTGSADDTPQNSPYPRLRVAGAVNPDSDGFYMEFDSDVPHDYTAIDLGELPTHDSGTSYWADSGGVGKRNLTKSSVANPLPNPCTVLWNCLIGVGNLGGAGKLALFLYMRHGGVNSSAIPPTGVTPSTTHGGYGAYLNTSPPGGGAWSRSHADANALEWGATVPPNAAASKFTLLPGPVWVYYESFLPLAPLPTAVAVITDTSKAERYARPLYDLLAEQRPQKQLLRDLRDIDRSLRRGARNQHARRRVRCS